MTPEQVAKLEELNDHEEEVQRQLREEYPHDDVFLRQADEFVYQVNYARTSFLKAVEQIGTEADRGAQNLQREFCTAKFYLFALLSTPSTIAAFMYNESARLKGVSKDVLHPFVDRWKRSPATRIVRAMRDAVQHGSLFRGSIGFKRWRDWSAGDYATMYMVDSGAWAKLIGRCNSDVRDYAEATLTPSADPLALVLEDYESALSELVGNLRHALNVSVDPEVQLMRVRLLQEQAEVRAEFDRFWQGLNHR